MPYFINFPEVAYKFGNESTFNAIQNIASYVDVIDSIKDQSSFYIKYTILDGERPDILSEKIYGTSRYYWTFYAMNDNIRRQGWPLPYSDLLAKAQFDYPNTTVVTRSLIFDKFEVGDTVSGNTSGAQGTILRRNLDLGQIIVKVTNNKSFQDSEIITDGTDTVTVQSSSAEHLSAHHYENSDGIVVDIDPENGPGGLLTEITYLDKYVEANDDLKEIRVIKPENINQVARVFKEALTGA